MIMKNKDIVKIAKTLGVTGTDGHIGGIELGGANGISIDGADGKHYSFLEIIERYIELIEKNIE
ncbi:hypothetical protein ABE073_04755 [Lederbergia citrisecunda]|uniref:hypothetical protein n=1 Tax=Lederbergia citrisecunda TaxID=2833583 RepID=UPI003D2D2422